MYQKRKAKSDRERFLEAFKKKVGCAPEVYVRRKLASGMNEEELSKLYDMLAIEIARRASCTAIRYADVLKTPEPKELCMQKAASFRVPVCEKCGANMVLRTGQSGARKGQKFWGCSNFPACRYTKNYEEKARGRAQPDGKCRGERHRRGPDGRGRARKGNGRQLLSGN